MYRKKNAVEKAKDAENCAIASQEEHKVVGNLVSEEQDWGAAGYARLGGLEFIKLEDAHSTACMARRQADDTHVGDSDGSVDKWDHTTHIRVYEDD